MQNQQPSANKNIQSEAMQLEVEEIVEEEVSFPIRDLTGSKSIFTSEKNYPILDERFRKYIERFIKYPVAAKQYWPRIYQNIKSTFIIQQHGGLINIRKILGISDNEGDRAIINSGILPKIMVFASQTEYPQMQFEAARVLKNLSAGQLFNCLKLIQFGGILAMLKILQSSNINIVRQGIQMNGNIASRGASYRDAINQKSGLDALLKIQSMVDDALLEIYCWSLRSLISERPLVQDQAVISYFCRIIISKQSDEQIVQECCLGIAQLTLGFREDNKVILINSGVIPSLMRQLQLQNDNLLISTLKVINIIACGTHQQANELLNHGLFERLQTLLNHRNLKIRMSACSIISSITAPKSDEQTRRFLNSRELIGRLFHLFQTDYSCVKAEICYVFSNLALSFKVAAVFDFYCQTRIFRYYFDILANASKHYQILETALNCLGQILEYVDRFKIGRNENLFVIQLEQMGFKKILNQMCQCSALEQSSANKLYNRYFRQR